MDARRRHKDRAEQRTRDGSFVFVMGVVEQELGSAGKRIGVGALWPTHIIVTAREIHGWQGGRRISLLVEPNDVELERLRLLEAAPHELVHGEYLLAGERNTRESVSTGERDVRENVSACEREG